MLRSEGVHVVDGHAILEEEKARSPHALFPPGGVHWNRYAASLVLRRAWQLLGEQLGRPLVDLRCRAVLEDDAPVAAGPGDGRGRSPERLARGPGRLEVPAPRALRRRRRATRSGPSSWSWATASGGCRTRSSRTTGWRRDSDFYYYFNELEPQRGDPNGSPRPPGTSIGG